MYMYTYIFILWYIYIIFIKSHDAKLGNLGANQNSHDLHEKGLDMQHSDGQGLQVELTIRINTIVSYLEKTYYNSEGQNHCLFYQ